MLFYFLVLLLYAGVAVQDHSEECAQDRDGYCRSAEQTVHTGALLPLPQCVKGTAEKSCEQPGDLFVERPFVERVVRAVDVRRQRLIVRDRIPFAVKIVQYVRRKRLVRLPIRQNSENVIPVVRFQEVLDLRLAPSRLRQVGRAYDDQEL